MINKYQEAIALMNQNDLDRFQKLIQINSELAQFRPPSDALGNQNTLLHEVTGMGNVQSVEHAPRMAQILIDHGADVNATEKAIGGETPLIHAVSINNVPVTEVLLKNGADPEKTGRYDGTLDTALGYALFYSQDQRLARYDKDCPQLLVESGAEILLPFAAAMHQNDLAKSLLILSNRKTQMQSFFFACKYGNLTIAKQLLALGIEINTKMPFFHYHLTALHLACEHGNQVEMVAFLLDNGADVSIKDESHQATAIDWAKYCRQDQVALLFRERGLI